MRALTVDQIKKIWLDKKWQEGETFNLYIDSPFCVCLCKYCIYSPTKTRINSDIYKKYYYEYLPKLIEDFREVLESRPIDTVYFGGGTSSLMTVDIMKEIFNLIPNFKEIPNKVFENHPAFTTKEKVDLLIENNFSYLSFGIQSLDKELIKNQNRIHFKEEKLKELIKYIQSNGIKVNCDLLAFMETGTVEDLKTLEKDLFKLSEEFMPDIITIFPMYQRIYTEFNPDNTINYTNEEQKEHNYKLISKLRRVLLKFNRKSKYFHICEFTRIDLDKTDIIENAKGNYFFIRMSDEEFRQVKKYSSSGYPHQPDNQNVLGLGGYGKRQPYTYHGRKFFSYLVNDNWTPKFIVNE